jgi:hypothetical protein
MVMTRPRWIRKREEVMDRLEYIAKVTYHQGRLEFTVNDIEHIISFKGEDGEKKWDKLVLSATNIIISAYKGVARKEVSKPTEKYLLYTSTDTILSDIFMEIENIWRKEGQPVVIEPKEVIFKK